MSVTRVLLLSSGSLTVQRWRGPCLQEAFAFEAEGEGMERYAHYIEASPREPTLLLVDLVEEEFTVEAMPHVIGRARAQLHARRGERLFGATPFRSARTLGREHGGRRDDRVLVSALTHPEAISPWLKPLLDAGVPLRAISSVAHLSGCLPRTLGLEAPTLLLVTCHEEALRQTFFHGGQLRLSRLSRTGFAPAAILEEIARTRRYLQSCSLLAGGAELAVYLLGDEPLLSELERQPLPEGVRLRLVLLDEAAAHVRIGDRGSMGAAALFGGLFHRAPVNRYAQAVHLCHWRSHRARIATELSAIALALVLCVTAMGAAVAAMEARREAFALTQSAHDEATQLRRATIEALPDGLTPDQLRDRVETAERIARLTPGPEPALARLGAALRSRPEIELHSIVWAASTDPGFGDLPAAGEEPYSSAALQGNGGLDPDHVYQSLVVHGQVAAQGGALRRAAESAEELRLHFSGRPEVLEASLPATPVDPAASLKASVGRDDPPPAALPLVLRVVFRP